MKIFILASFLFLGLGFIAAPTLAYADWTYGSAYFRGDKPRKTLGYRTPLEYCIQLFNFDF